MSKENFLKEVARQRGSKTNLKAHKVDLGLVDEIESMISDYDVQSQLDSVYSKYDDAKLFGIDVLNEIERERDNIADKVTELESALNELGIDSFDATANYGDAIYKIDRETEGLMQYLDNK
tara:strand:+ start:419 stop:781 length:363 start_codon:yes stop_codon:yes gene_type:complete